MSAESDRYALQILLYAMAKNLDRVPDARLNRLGDSLNIVQMAFGINLTADETIAIAEKFDARLKAARAKNPNLESN